jgi:hypothetical protein
MEEVKTATEEIKEDAKDILDHATDFLETYYQLLTINIAQKGVNIASAVINGVVLCFLGLFVFAFIGLGLAWWLGDLVNSRIGGFFIMAGIYLVVMIVLIIMRKKVIFPFLRDLITKKIYE